MDIYIVAKDPAWDEDFIAVFSSIHEAAKYICDTLAADEEEYLDYKEVERAMTLREKQNYFYLYLGDGNYNHFNARKAHLYK